MLHICCLSSIPNGTHIQMMVFFLWSIVTVTITVKLILCVHQNNHLYYLYYIIMYISTYRHIDMLYIVHSANFSFFLCVYVYLFWHYATRFYHICFGMYIFICICENNNNNAMALAQAFQIYRIWCERVWKAGRNVYYTVYARNSDIVVSHLIITPSKFSS